MPNQEQIEYWNAKGGPRWVEQRELLDRQLAQLGDLVLDAVPWEQGHRILDVGCGTGGSTLDLARRLDPAGSVVGMDVSKVMLECAKSRVQSDVVSWICADAQTHALEEQSFDGVFSRFGVMFFDDPVSAFTNFGRAVRNDGWLGFVCWKAFDENPWLKLPLEAIASLIPEPEPRDPNAPGPAAFADRDRVTSILSRAGFVDIQFENHRPKIQVGGTSDFDRAIEFNLEIGPAAAALREHGDHLRGPAKERLIEAFKPYRSDDGILMDASVWVVTARARRSA